MATPEVVTITDLAKLIKVFSQKKFTGLLALDIKDVNSQQWSLYFCMGALIWGSSNLHPIRRCYRQISLHYPQLPIHSIQPQDWNYDFLAELLKQGRLQREQVVAIVESQVTEILFDIYQQGEKLSPLSGFQLTYQSIPRKTIDLLIDSSLVLIRADEVWQRSKQEWEAWQQAGLTNYSPNHAPTILKAKELQRQTPLLTYYNLTNLANGKQTLRDLAVKLKQNLLLLTQSLMPFIRQGLMELIEVEDLSNASVSVTASKPQPAPSAPPVNNPVQERSTSSLIAYIDDSKNDSMTMRLILTQAGYRFINIQDPMQALPTLLEHKPDLIFLDLVMPIANGYEICAQIRRVSAFKDTPVIILTSNDGIVDRVRAKMVGSTGFLAKPIETEKVLKVLQRYLPTSTTIQSTRLQTDRTWSIDQQV